jgi:hypothetical protein
MKTYLRFTSLVFVLFAMSLLIFSGCKKDDNNNGGNSYRLIEQKGYFNDVLSSTATCHYEGEKIVLMLGYDYSSRGDSTKTQITYPDANTIVMVDYNKDGSTWMQDYKEEYTYLDDNLTREIYYEFIDNNWGPEDKYEYIYSNGTLTEEIWYTYDFGEWAPVYKDTYEYNGNLIAKTLTYYYYEGSFELAYMEEASYTGNKISEITGSVYADGVYMAYYKYKYQYNGDLISKIFMLSFDTSWDTTGYFAFTYDSHNNVETWSNIYPDGGFKSEFIYEEGKGNLGKLQQSGGMLVLPYPTKSSPAGMSVMRDNLCPATAASAAPLPQGAEHRNNHIRNLSPGSVFLNR